MHERKLGIEILRILCMYMIIILHILAQGGILSNTVSLSIKYESTWLLEILCYCAVNCYAIISGYVMCMSKVKYYKIVILWFQVAFYSILITIIFSVFLNCKIGIGQYISAFTPVLSQQYWYFTAYFGMFLIVPFMNILIETMNRKQFEMLLFIFFIWFSFLPILRQIDTFGVSNGYSMIWISIMYMVGAYIRKYVNVSNISKKKAISVYFLACLVTWANKWILEKLTLKFLGEIRYSNIFIKYVSPTFVIASIGIFVLFLKVDIHNDIIKKVVKVFAPVSFSVYLIHTHPMIFEYIIKDRFIKYLECSPIVLIVKVLITAFLGYLACSLIDCIRIVIFKLLNVEQKCIKLLEIIKEKLLIIV